MTDTKKTIPVQDENNKPIKEQVENSGSEKTGTDDQKTAQEIIDNSKKTKDPTKKDEPKRSHKKKSENTTPTDKTPEAVTENGGPLPHGVEPDQNQINQSLALTMSDLQVLTQKVGKAFGPSYDYAGLVEALRSAQDWIANKLDLEKGDNGYVRKGETQEAPMPSASVESDSSTR